MRQDWRVSVGRNQWRLHLWKEPRWALVLEGFWYGLCWLTRGWAGGHGGPGWMDRVPVGRAHWDHSDPEEPWLENSLAGTLYRTENWFAGLSTRFGQEVASVPIDKEMARMISPKFVADMDKIDNEEEAI